MGDAADKGTEAGRGDKWKMKSLLAKAVIVAYGERNKPCLHRASVRFVASRIRFRLEARLLRADLPEKHCEA